jgi:hypothetical protein
MEYQIYDRMGLPITWETFNKSRKPSDLNEFSYLYEGITEEDYQVAISVEERKCYVTFSEFSTSKEDKKDDTNKDLLTCEFTADDTDDANKSILHSPPN